MKLDRKEKIWNRIMLIGIILFILSAIFSIQYYFFNKSNECLANPFIYGAKQMKEEAGYEFVGSGYFLTPTDTRSPIIIFNSTSMTVQK